MTDRDHAPEPDRSTLLAERLVELRALHSSGVLTDTDLEVAIALAEARSGVINTPPPPPGQATRRWWPAWAVITAVLVIAAVSVVAYIAVSGGGSGSVAPNTAGTRPATRPVPGLHQFHGNDFSIGYPTSFYIETSEVDKGSYADTTLRKLGTDDTLVRVNFSAGDMSNGMDSAFQLEQGVASSSGYRRIGITPTTLAGMPAARWEFLTTTDSGRTLRTVNILGHNAAGGWGVMTRAPETGYAKWAPVFKRVRASFDPRG